MTDFTDIQFFKPSELACRCCGDIWFDRDALLMLDKARRMAGIPFVITSACRCEVRNAEVGGAQNSAHLRGYAVDIRTRNSWERFRIKRALYAVGFKRIGTNYARGFVHADNDQSLPQEVDIKY
jgi:uncharacterized protein YcbK (DUF882 family)